MRYLDSPLRVAFVGAPVWLDGCAPPASQEGGARERFAIGLGGEAQVADVRLFGPDVTVVFDPLSLAQIELDELPGALLGVLVEAPAPEVSPDALERLDRLVGFDPALSGSELGSRALWRAIPPPVCDELYMDAGPRITLSRAMSLGRSSPHREAMLTPAKHHHDLLHLVQGVRGELLRELLGDFDIGVHVAREPGGAFGHQVGMHLAAGQLLLSEELSPSHGLEADIDFVQFTSPDGLVWALERLARFPEMHRMVQIRGRLKAEQFRASRLFERLIHDFLADLAAFGSAHSPAGG